MRGKLSLPLAALCAIFCWTGAGAEEKASPEPRVDYKAHFKDAGKKLILGNGFANGSTKLSDDTFRQKAPSIFLTDEGVNGIHAGFNMQIPGDMIEKFKNKPLSLKFYIKRTAGNGQFTARMRTFKVENGKWDLICASPEVSFKGKDNEWTLMEVRSRIPDTKDVKNVDFQVGFRPSPVPTTYYIDDPVLEVASEGGAKFESVMMGAQPRAEKPLEIVKDGKAMAVIVTEAKPTACARYAAKELAEHVELCTGVKLQIVTEDKFKGGGAIHVGRTALTTKYGAAPEYFAPDNWMVRSVGGALILSGGESGNRDANPESYEKQPFGTLYAVYEFLERELGVRWYWPGKRGVDAPKMDKLEIGKLDIVGAPSYKVRLAFYQTTNTPDALPADSVKWWRRMRLGSAGGDPIGMHSFNSWPERFGESHPEYFAVQTDGKPRTKADGAGGHVCMSNPNVFKQVVQDKRDAFEKNKWNNYSPVMPGDSDDLFHCRCKECQSKIQPEKGSAGKHSDLTWDYVNRVAAEVQKTHPGKYITCCAYGNYQKPPAFGLMPNVAVTLCYYSNMLTDLWDPAGKGNYNTLLDSWKKTGATVCVWDYWNSSRYGKGIYGAPAVYPRAIKEWLALDYGRVDGHVIELCEISNDGKAGHNWEDWVYDALNIYVAYRLLWNMDQDVYKMLDEFHTKFYGPAAPWMKKFNDEMEAAYLDPNTKKGPNFGWDWESCWIYTYNPAFVERVMGYLQKAVEATEGKEPYSWRAKRTLEAYKPFERNSKAFGNTAKQKNTSLAVPPAKDEPKIDGDGSDACWKDAVATGGFLDSFGLYKLRGGTDMKFLRDDKNLYVLVSCSFDPAQGIKPSAFKPKSRDAYLWNEESCELFFVAGGKKYQFLFGPDGSLTDFFYEDLSENVDLNKSLKWNCEGVRYAAVADKAGWTGELSIPLASIQFPKPTEDKPWLVNFCRNHFHKPSPDARDWQNELSVWQPTFGSFHNVDRFGKLWLK